jgi:hypothetical protein
MHERQRDFDPFRGQGHADRGVATRRHRRHKAPQGGAAVGGACKKTVVTGAQAKFTAIAKEANLTPSQILIGNAILRYMRGKNGQRIAMEDVAGHIGAELRQKYGRNNANGRRTFFYCPRRTHAGPVVFIRLFDRMVESKILVVEGKPPKAKIMPGKNALGRAERLRGVVSDKRKLAVEIVKFYSTKKNQVTSKTVMSKTFVAKHEGKLFEFEFRELGIQPVKRLYQNYLRGVCVEEEGHTGRDARTNRKKGASVITIYDELPTKKDPKNTPYKVRPVRGAVKAVDNLRYRNSSRDLARAVVSVLGNGGVTTKEELAIGVAKRMAKNRVVPKLRGKDLTADMVWDTYQGLLARRILA